MPAKAVSSIEAAFLFVLNVQTLEKILQNCLLMR